MTRSRMIHIDRVSSIDHLPKPAKPDDVLAVLRRTPRVSCFELSERSDLVRAIETLKATGKIKNGADLGYPWVAYEVMDT